ncbi:MAG TPA: hypothetical protein VFE42_00620 [Chloroflexota bacterium]|nr:hypothetical protein [Chloroflexota bacterium]
MTPSTESALARRLWTVFEPYHALIYFAPEARAAYADAGLKGFWMGYFASRSAALGAAPASVVTATFYTFAPRMVERAIPDAWRFSSPERVLAARLDAADAALRRLLGAAISTPDLRRAATLARRAVEGCDVAGRPLFVAHRHLPWPQAPHLALWHAATLLREHRFDGHVAALLGSGLDGCEALLSFTSSDATWRQVMQMNRGWTDEEWEAARGRLEQRGWVDRDGTLTAVGQECRAEIERQTDRLALPPLDALGAAGAADLYDLLLPLARTIVAQGGIPLPNPVGVPEP